METENVQPIIPTGEESHQPKFRVMFLEYGDKKPWQNDLSVIIKKDGERWGVVGARVYRTFEGEGTSKHPVYTTRDAEGKHLFPPSTKLWELKKSIKTAAQSLYDNAHPEMRAYAKAVHMSKQAAVDKQRTGIEKQITDGAKKIEAEVKAGTDKSGREQELKKVRDRKIEQGKDMERGL